MEENSSNNTRDSRESRDSRPPRDHRGGGQNRGRGGQQRRPQSNKEWRLIEKMLMQGAEEQKKTRRWGLFFKFSMLAYFFIALMVFRPSFWTGDSPASTKPHAALVEVKGIIMAGYEANADSIVAGLREAFEAENSKAVVLRINSPGGSPVQSGMVYREIMRLKGDYPNKKIYAAITDVGASGAYYIASAADEIYADPSSIVGSIGVISDGFGFTGALEKLGIERRVYTSGDNKAMLDPFSPLNPEQKEFFESMLTNVHEQFISAVKEGRGERIKDDKVVFSGLMWSGEQAIEFGLIDGLKSPGEVARDIVGLEEVVDYTPRANPFQSFADRLGVSMATTLARITGLEGVQLR